MAGIILAFFLSLFVSHSLTFIQLVNNKTKPISSSTYTDYVASRVVDGDFDQSVSRCFHSDYCFYRSTITEAWLCMDLGRVYSLKSIKIWYRGGRKSPYMNTARLRGYSLRVSNDTTVPPPQSSCYTDPGNVTLPTIVEEDCERTARYIWIYQSNKSYHDLCPKLGIYEVQVYGCETGHYGENYSSNCNHCKNNATCGITNGKCDDIGCACSLYQPPLCKGCIPGMYGLHCEKNCSRYCGFINCDRKTAACFDGCKNGYIRSFCNQTCPIGKYGPNCGEICGHCYNNSDCYHGNGTCLEGCEAGYWNHECKTLCSDGRYGENCQYTCSGNCVNGEACEKTKGNCRSCVDGFQGSKCDRDIRQSPTDLKKKMDIDHMKMERMMLENQKTEKRNQEARGRDRSSTCEKERFIKIERDIKRTL